MKTVRIWFEKRGDVKYISHLDLNRAILRGLQRSELPIWYTEGYNKHAYITFALPLPLGFESLCESFDFRLMEDLPMEEVVERLNAQMPEGIRIYDACEPADKPDAIAYADYRVRFLLEGMTPAESLAAFHRMAEGETLILPKKTKKGIREIDVRPMFEVKDSYADEQLAVVLLRTHAGSRENLNPALLFEALAEREGRTLWDVDYLRSDILTGVYDDLWERYKEFR